LFRTISADSSIVLPSGIAMRSTIESLSLLAEHHAYKTLTAES
jgi:hypothetical protein